MSIARTLADLGSASLATDAELASHAADTTSVHGVADTAALATQAYADTAGGLVHVDTQTFTGVSSKVLDGCFTSTYRNYKVILDATNANTAAINFQFRYLESTVSANNYYWQQSIVRQFGQASTAYGSPATQIQIQSNVTGVPIVRATFDVLTPYAAAYSSVLGTSFSQVGGNYGFMTFSGVYNAVTDSHSGFVISTSAGTFSGTVSVYGYA